VKVNNKSMYTEFTHYNEICLNVSGCVRLLCITVIVSMYIVNHLV